MAAGRAVKGAVPSLAADLPARARRVLLGSVQHHPSRGQGLLRPAAQGIPLGVGITVYIAIARPGIELHVDGPALAVAVPVMHAGQGIAADLFDQKNDTSFFSKLAHMLSRLLATLPHWRGAHGATRMLVS